MTHGAAARDRILYGRRFGRKLRAHRKGLMQNALPRYGFALPEAGGALDLSTLFDRPVSRVRLEIGFGNGEHLAAQAARDHDTGFLGCEPFVNGVSMCLQHLEAAGLDNVRLHPDDARAVLDALPDASLDRVWVLFPDPWPKTRHHRRRFIGPDNLDKLARVLRPGGELRVATDHVDCGRWMLMHCLRHPAFDWLAEGPRDWQVPAEDESPTRYEGKAQDAGRACLYLRFRRRPPV